MAPLTAYKDIFRHLDESRIRFLVVGDPGTLILLPNHKCRGGILPSMALNFPKHVVASVRGDRQKRTAHIRL